LIRRNEALAILGLTPKQHHVDWLERHWQGELAWDVSGQRKARKGYSPVLIESLKINLDLPAIRAKK